MSYEIIIDGVRHAADVGGAPATPLLRVRRCADGSAVCITAADALRDGLPLLGNLTRIEWGSSALLRIGRTRVEIRWRAACERRPADAGACCRVCFGRFALGEVAVACVCGVLFHNDCERARLTCPGCGASPDGDCE